MPFNVTDDALEALDGVDDSTRLKFFSGLSDNERTAIADALPGWKQRRSGGSVGSQADQFVSSLGQGTQGRTPTSPGFDLNSSPGVATPAQPAQVQPDSSVPKNTLAPQELAFNPLGPIGAGIGWLGDKARAAQDAVFKTQREGPIGQALPNAQATGEMLTRSLTGSLLGEKSNEGQPDESKLRAINTMEQHVGQNLTTAALVGAQAVGNAGQMLLPVGEVGQLTKEATTAQKMLVAGTSGGVQGFLLSALQGGDTTIGTLAGAGLGVGFAGAGEVAKAVAPKIGKAATKAVTFVGDEAKAAWEVLRELHAPAAVGETAPILAGEVAGPAPARLPVGKVRPSHIQITQDQNTGEIVAIIHDYSANKLLERKTAELPLSTPDDVEKFVAWRKKHDVPSLMFDDTALNNMSSYDQLRITAPEKQFSPYAPDEPALSLEMGADEYAKYLKDLEADAKRGDRPTLGIRPGNTPSPNPPPNVDAPIEFHPEPDFEMHVGPDGHVELKPPEPPSPAKKPASAQRGYIKQPDANGTPTSEAVDRIANDPDMPGHILVEGTNGELKSVPAAEFHPALTPSQSMEEIAKMGAEPVRIPAQPAKPGDLSPQTIDEGRILNEDVQAMVRRNPTYGQAIFGKTGLVSNHHMGDRDMAAVLLEANAAKDQAAVKGEVLHALTKAVGGPKQMNSLLDKDLKKVMQGGMSMADFQGKYPGVAQKVSPLVQNMMERRNELHQELIKLGALPADALDQGKMEAYLTQAYYRYLFPKKWAGMVEQKTLESAAQAIAKQFKGRGEKWTGQQIYTELQGILGSENPALAFYSSNMGKSKAFDSLRPKQELPPFIKNLLGEVDSGMYSMAETLSRQEQLAARFRMYHELAANPAYYSHGPQPHLDGRQVPALPKEFGPLAGGYVAPEIYDNIIDHPKMQAHASNFMNKLTSFRKGNQMASIRAHLRNNIGNWQSNMLAGGISWERPIESGKAMRDAAKALASYMRDPTGKTGMGNIVKEMRSAGADWAGHAESEIGKDSPYIREMLKKIAKDTNSDAFDITETLMHGTWGRYKGAIAKNGGMLDLQDRFYRVANYIGLKKKFLGNPSRYLPGVAPGDIEKEAVKLAARRINDSFMNAAHVGKNVDALRRSNVGMLAPYGTAMAEEARIIGLIPSRMAEDPDLKWRLASWGMFGAAGAGALKYGLGGTPPEAFESARGNMTDMSRARRPGLLPLPLSGMGDKEPVRMFDASQYFLPSALFPGHPDDAMLQRVFANALLYPASGGAAEAPERQLLESLGIVKPINYDQKQMQSEIGLVNFANQIARAGGVPAQITQTMDAVDKTQYNGRWGAKWNPADVAGKMAFTGYSGPVSPLSPAGIKEDKGTRRDLHGELKVIARQYAGGKLTKAEAEAKMKVVVDEIKASGAKTAERGNLMKSYMDSYTRGKK